MHSALPAAHVGAVNSLARSTSETARRAALLLLFVAALLAGGAEAVRGQSALDGFDPNANGVIQIVVVQPDGKILIGGTFTTLSPNGGAAVTRNNIARLNPDGTLDTAFNPNANANISSIAVQADGKILAGGNFFGANSIGGQTRNYIARLDATTGLADSFNPNANDVVLSIAVQMDGKILAGGFFTSIGGQPRNRIARVDATTGLADSFSPNSNDFVVSIAAQADGKILAGGDFTTIGGQPRNRIARLDAMTGLADSFNPNATSTVLSIAVQADGKILVGGQFSNIGGQTRFNIARLDPTTGLADSFDPNSNGIVFSIALEADGKVLAGGSYSTLAPNGGASVPRNNVARLETDGRIDQTLNLNLDGTVATSAVQPDGKIIISGTFTTVLGVARNNLARINTDGSLDMTFDPNADSDVTSITVQADGKILVTGFFNVIGGQVRNYIARLNGTTGMPDSFNPNPHGGHLFSMAIQADGKILVGGEFTDIGGQMRNHIARLDATTGLADSFNPNATGGSNGTEIFSIAVQSDGKIIAAGTFTSIGGQPRNNIARLDPTTGAADSFDPNASGGLNGAVGTIAIQADGKILAGGFFTSIGGQPRNYIARLNATTGAADSFAPNPNSEVHSLGLESRGKILVGGNFTGIIGGQTRNRIARLDPISGLADSFNPNPDAIVYSIALQSDGKVVTGGGFASLGGQSRRGFARLTNDAVAMQGLMVTQTAITWTREGSSTLFERATFEYSTDNATYTFLGNGTPTGSGSILTGLNLPTGQNIYIRARGYYRGGHYNASGSIAESVRNAFIAGPPGTPTPTPTPSTTPVSSPTPTPHTPTPTPVHTPTPTPTPHTPTPTPHTPTPAPTPTATATPVAATSLINVSTRLRVLTADNALIGGFIVGGNAPKRVLVRGIGPSLTGFGIPGALVDPVLELHGPGAFSTITNDNWRDTQETEIQATGLAPSNDLESAIVAMLPPGAYTAVVRGTSDGTGVGLVEAYDLDATADAKLANISTRGFVDLADNAMIGGFILGNGSGSTRVLIRAIGPSLTGFGVPDALADPTLELHNSDGATIAANDNWKDTQQGEIEATGLPPSDDHESAIVGTLMPGAYTAVVRGKNDTTGVGLVEAYQLATPTPTPGLTPTPAPTATPAPSPTPTLSFDSLSSRATVGAGDAVTLNAFIITGASAKRVLLRGIGPTLIGVGIPNPLADPVIELRGPSGFQTIINNNWKDTQQAEIEATGMAPTNDLESAIVATLAPGFYTVLLRANDGGTGVGLNQLYDLTQGGSSALTAVGTRADVLTGNDILVSGITVSQAGQIVVRFLGPSLADAGVANTLADPSLELRDENGALIIANNDWQDDPAQAAQVVAAGLAPTNTLEAALVASLSPGSYTALGSGVSNGTGIGYVQFYTLPHTGPVLPITP